jgi:hypothetical protein
VNGIDGSFALTADKGNIHLQVNKLDNTYNRKNTSNDDDDDDDDDDDVRSVDSTSNDNSYAQADKGQIYAILDPEV